MRVKDPCCAHPARTIKPTTTIATTTIHTTVTRPTYAPSNSASSHKTVPAGATVPHSTQTSCSTHSKHVSTEAPASERRHQWLGILRQRRPPRQRSASASNPPASNMTAAQQQAVDAAKGYLSMGSGFSRTGHGFTQADAVFGSII